MPDFDDELLERARERVGQMLCGKYRLERVLGVGGMAVVYVARHRNGRLVAIKMLHPELSIRADLRKRFLLEAHAANAVNHPGAVAILDDDVGEDGAAFLVMELLEGQSVEELWRANAGVLAPKTVLTIARELCETLGAAHAVEVIHRDIKPANLFLTIEGRVKVLDFGLARVRDGTACANATATGLVFGTPAFLPPEQAAGRISQIDRRTDIWAVGATMFTLLTGRTVHEGESAQHLVMLAATKPSRSLKTLLPDADNRLVALVDRALAFERDDRWRSADEMHAAILAASDALLGDPSPALGAMSDVVQIATTTPEHRPASTARRLPDEPVGTTSAPVASAAPTHPDERQRAFTRGLAAVRGVLASIPMSTGAWQRRASFAALFGVMIAGGFAFGVSRLLASDSSQGASTNAGTPLPVMLEPSPSASHVDAKPRDVPSSSATPELSPPVPAAVRAAAPKPAGHHTSRPAISSARPREKEPDCTQEFTIDPNGKKIWKPECVR